MASQSHDFSHEFNDGEKGTVNPEKNVGGAKLPSFDVARSGSRTGSVAVELEDDRYLQTQRGLKSRHAQMIAIGGTIGTGLFVGSGQTLARGGPAFIAITEIAAYLPVHGGTMSYYGYRYVSRSLGFAMGYLLVWPLSFPEAPWILMIVQILVFSRYSGSI
jgi:amino acid permease